MRSCSKWRLAAAALLLLGGPACSSQDDNRSGAGSGGSATGGSEATGATPSGAGGPSSGGGPLGGGLLPGGQGATAGQLGTGAATSGGGPAASGGLAATGGWAVGGARVGGSGGTGSTSQGGATEAGGIAPGSGATGGNATAGRGGATSDGTGGATTGGASTGGANDTGGSGGGVTVSGTQYLSDLCDSGNENGWGPVERDLSNGEREERDGGPIIINGEYFGKGLGMHAPAEMTFALDGRCSALRAEVGVDDEMRNAGSVAFQVWGDGQLLHETDTVEGWQGPLPLEVDISGVQELRLVVDDVGGNGSDHADWGDARVVCSDLAANTCTPVASPIPVPTGWHLTWSDEFDVDGLPDPESWDYESGFVRNNEWQCYTSQNATVVGGFLVIQGRRESHRCGNEGMADYTSSSLRTVRYSPWAELHTFQYGRFEMRARIVAESGLWPAFWTLGTGLGNWPFNGEIDIMEYYDGRVHANVASSNSTNQNAYSAKWDGASRLVSDFGVEDWDAKFHIWQMDWDSERIVLSLDGTVMNDVPISTMHNADGTNPFAQPHYMLVNLAIGGDAGGDASATHFPVHYVVDYVRVFQRG